jgi:VWFA-related protein
MRTETPLLIAPVSRRFRLLTLALLVLAPVTSTRAAHAQASATPAAQSASAARPAAPLSTLQSNVSEVSLDLVVRDRKGRPVPGLSINDLAITDDGTPVKLSGLTVAKVAPDSPRLVTLVFDNLDSAMGKNARTLAARILKDIPTGNFSLSVVYVNGRLRLLQPYTTDRALIDRAVLTATGAPGTNAAADSALAEKTLTAEANTTAATPVAAGQAPVSAADRESARAMMTAIAESQRLAADQPFLDLRAVSGFAALTALAHAGEKLPGRKLVIYFSAGVEADTRAYDLVKSSAGAANRAEMSIYPVDLSTLGTAANDEMVVAMAMGSVRTGLALNPPAVATQFSAGDTTPVGIRESSSDNTTNLELGDPEGGSSPLSRLAHGTGGRYIPAQMNLSKQIRQLVDDASNFYVATYMPPINDYDGSFRAITVKSLRKDVFVRARSGYFALPPSAATGMRPFELPLLGLLKQPQPPADITFASRVVQFGELPEGLTQELVVEAPIGHLEPRKDANSGLFNVQVAVLAQVIDSSGVVIQQFAQELRRRGALDTLDSVQNDVLTFQRTFAAPPGNYTLKVALMDAIGQKSSVAQSEFKLAAAAPAPFLSDMVLLRRVETGQNPLKKEVSANDPMQFPGVVPDLSGVVSTGAKEASLFFVIHPGPAALGKAAMEITVSRDGRVVGHAPLPFRETADNGPVPYFSTLGTRSMNPGQYLVTARLTQGGQSFERSMPITIEGPSHAAETEIASAGGAPKVHGDAGPASSAAEATGVTDDASSVLPPLDITPAGPNAPQISAVEAGNKIEQARKRALDYAAGLPNFFCVETTNRSTDSSGKGDWKHQDSFSQVLTYRDRTESRRMVEFNGHPSQTEPDGTKSMVSHGEFGGILNAIFDPSAHATFVWKESGVIAGEHVDIFEYQVSAKDSSFSLTGDNNWQYLTAFHGVVSIDSSTLGVRQLTLVAEGLPKDFSIHASAIRVDYDYIAINGHDYLLPTRATIALRRRKHESVLNEIQFRDYKRFSARSRMVPVAQ